jgi:hypothetical protein
MIHIKHPFAARQKDPEVSHQTQNHLDAIDVEGRLHVILVVGTRHVTPTFRGAVVQTGGDRFFLAATKEPLVLCMETAKLCTEDGLQEFTFKVD